MPEKENPVYRLVRELERQGVPYCHWKSNEHLEAGITGETDLDLLFSRQHKEATLAILHDCGFRCFIESWHSRYPSISSYISVNPANGNLLHVHAHFALVIGESGVKSFELPWSEDYIASSTIEPGHRIRVPAPEDEMLVLVIRAAIKNHFRKPLQKSSVVEKERNDFIREFEWLKERVKESDFVEVAKIRLGQQIDGPFMDIYRSDLSEQSLFRFYGSLDKKINSHRINSYAYSSYVRYTRRFYEIFVKILQRLGVGVSFKHTAPDNGIIIALLGPDGSGKSTLIAGLSRALSKKIQTQTLYMGSGKGPSSVLRYPLILASKLRKGGIRNGSRASKARTGPSKKSTLSDIYEFLWAVTLAHEKKVKLRKAARARKNGIFVLADRYPQTSIVGYNDGPLLSDLRECRWSILRRVAEWEYNIYSLKSAPEPDLVIKLVADQALLNTRRPGVGEEIIRLKVQAVNQIQYGSGTTISIVDAMKSKEAVKTKAMVEIFEKYKDICEN